MRQCHYKHDELNKCNIALSISPDLERIFHKGLYGQTLPQKVIPFSLELRKVSLVCYEFFDVSSHSLCVQHVLMYAAWVVAVQNHLPWWPGHKQILLQLEHLCKHRGPVWLSHQHDLSCHADQLAYEVAMAAYNLAGGVGDKPAAP